MRMDEGNPRDRREDDGDEAPQVIIQPLREKWVVYQEG